MNQDTVVFRRRVAMLRHGSLLVDLAAEVEREIQKLEPADEASVRSLLGTLRSTERVLAEVTLNLSLIRGMQ